MPPEGGPRRPPPEELAESNWSTKGGYGWVAADVRNQSSLFRWSRLLNSWLNYMPVISMGVSGDVVSLERVSAIDRVCHRQEEATEKFFYMYMCHFSQLHVRLPLDDFTMGVLRALNVAPTHCTRIVGLTCKPFASCANLYTWSLLLTFSCTSMTPDPVDRLLGCL